MSFFGAEPSVAFGHEFADFLRAHVVHEPYLDAITAGSGPVKRVADR